MAAASRRLPDAMVSGIFTARSAAIRRTPRPPTPMLGVPQGSGPTGQARLSGHVLMENRHALVVDTRLTLATGNGGTRGRTRDGGGPPRQSSDHARCR